MPPSPKAGRPRKPLSIGGELARFGSTASGAFVMVMALLLALANPALVAFDEANQALTACGFSTHRRAAEANQSLDTFKASLGFACADEIARMRRAIVAVETGRGKSQSNARQSADQTIAQFHAMFGDGYARRDASEAQLKALIEASRGTSDAQ